MWCLDEKSTACQEHSSASFLRAKVGSPWLLGSTPVLERAIDALTFDFHLGEERHQGVYLCAETLAGAQRTQFPGETL